MRVLIVLAHPEPQSLTSALGRVIVDELQAEGHEIRVSDLYAMKWKSQIDRDDFPGRRKMPLFNQGLRHWRRSALIRSQKTW